MKQQQVTIGKTSDYPRGEDLVQTSTLYPEAFSLVVQRLWSQGSTNTAQQVSIVDTTKTYNPNNIISIEESVSATQNI